MKKSFPDEKGNKFREFLDKKGFYIVLLLCIAVVAGTAVYVTSRRTLDNTPPEYEGENLAEDTDDLAAEDAAADTGEKLTDLDPDEELVSRPGEKETDIGSPASVTKDGGLSGETDESSKKDTEPKDEAPGKDEQKKQQSAPAKQSFIMPVNGDISFEYAMDRLVYSKTLEQWRVHPGIDIAADRGTPVKAVADGVISDVRNDKFYGISVVIDHGDGLKTLYRNLASDEIVAVNQKVKQGEIIGSIGNTAMDESSEQPHLHFEVLVNDKNADPTDYLPIK
ncbi:MAG TPA: M23 family metallopeptidase [Clostridiales bacterium]|nr:M23 family metallopeptidase [Clostridiales bacterium]HPV01677.1 M23 family metallopeptidase [Clostridiales bacterium]